MALAAAGSVSTILVGAIVIGIMILAIKSIRKKKKEGGCCGGCAGCSHNCRAGDIGRTE